MALIKTVNLDGKWLHEVYTADTPPEEFGVFSEMKSLWDSKRQPPRLPAWSDFSFEDFNEYYGWLAVEDIVSQSPFNSVFRLWGSRWVEAFEVELTGKQFIDVEGPYGEDDGPAFWTEMCRTDHIVVGQGSMSWLEKLHRFSDRQYMDLTLPLSDDGKHIDKYLNVLALV